MTQGEIYYHSVDPDSWQDAEGEIYRAVKMDGYANLLYRGQITESRYKFEGRLKLELSLEIQTVNATYSATSADGALDPDIKFELTGRFLDEAFSCFEGYWTEIAGANAAAWQFSIEDLRLN